MNARGPGRRTTLGLLASRGVFIFLLALPAFGEDLPSWTTRYAALTNPAQRSAPARLHDLFQVHWEYTMREFPEMATAVGYPAYHDRWTDQSLDAMERRKKELEEPLKALRTIDRGALSGGDQLNYDLFKRNLLEELAGIRFPAEFLILNQLGGIQQDAGQVISMMPLTTPVERSNLLGRLKALPTAVDQTLTLLQKGLAQQITPPQITLRDVPEQIRSQTQLDQNPIRLAIHDAPGRSKFAGSESFDKEVDSILQTQVLPAFSRLHNFFAETYLAKARRGIALSDLPQGREWYEYLVRRATTTTLSPGQIHEIGLAEVKRLRKRMDDLIGEIGFKGTFADFSAFLRTNKQFYFTSSAELLTAYRDIAKRADPELARLFGHLPRLPYGVLPVPAYAEKSQTTAYYLPGSPDAGRPGYFYANTYALESRPKWEMEALTFHEAVPGHHLQIALSQEMEKVPEFRKHGSYTAFVEGWGLYAESLGEEMGFYKDPYSAFGRLTYEIWRAIRLVVDTGIHHLGWTRQQAIDYFQANSSKPIHDIVVEVDRYIVWPGQALAYKIGELKIKELRAYAGRELGTNFNLRTFHDQVLGNGAVPLEILEREIKSWVGKEKAKG